jgi:hypothetical protein
LTTIDGLQTTDLVGSNYQDWTINMEAVSEVRVLTSNYQAEYGRVPGAQIIAVTKSGTKDFHGEVYGFFRNEALNANNFFSNLNNVPRPRYRYDTFGLNLGGPVFIPHLFNSGKSKLFAFYSGEFWWTSQAPALGRFTVPTALERTGDFSQTRDLNNQLIVIKDPATGQPFSGNIIPASRVNPNGLALLGIFPLPNFTNRAISKGTYSYVIQDRLIDPKHEHILRVDYNPDDQTSLYLRAGKWWEDVQGINTPLANAAWGVLPNTYESNNRNAVLHGQHVFSSTMVLEASAGYTQKDEFGPAQN